MAKGPRRLKEDLAVVLLQHHDLDISYTRAGYLTAACRAQLGKAGYYWFPSQRAWCYRPDLLEARQARFADRVARGVV